MMNIKRNNVILDDDDSFEPYALVTLLQYLRIWPLDNSFSIFKNILITMADVALILGTFLLATAEFAVVIVNFNLQTFANAIGTACLHTTGIVKWVFCIQRSKEISLLMGELTKCHLLSVQDVTDAGRKHYNGKMIEARTNANYFVFIWTAMCVYGVLHWTFAPLFVQYIYRNTNSTVENQYRLPFVAWYPWDIDNYYTYTYVLQGIGGLGSALGIVSYDIFYLFVLMFMRVQLEYLNTFLVDDNHTEHGSYNMHSSLDKKLRKCVDHHSQILTTLDNLQTLVNPMMFVQCMETLLVICLLSFQGSTLKITIDFECFMMVWTMVEYFVAATTQLYLFCFYATQIKSLSADIADSAYCSGWEYADDKRNKEAGIANAPLISQDVKCLIEMIMLRAQKPIILTGGPFYELSLETFKSIIGMAMSNSVILRQVSES